MTAVAMDGNPHAGAGASSPCAYAWIEGEEVVLYVKVRSVRKWILLRRSARERVGKFISRLQIKIAKKTKQTPRAAIIQGEHFAQANNAVVDFSNAANEEACIGPLISGGAALLIAGELHSIILNAPRVDSLSLPVCCVEGYRVHPNVAWSFFKGEARPIFKWTKLPMPEALSLGETYVPRAEDVKAKLQLQLHAKAPHSDDNLQHPLASAVTESPCIVLNCPEPFRSRMETMQQEARSESASDPNAFKCATYNILYANRDNPDYLSAFFSESEKAQLSLSQVRAIDATARLTLTASEILESGSDVILLQEVTTFAFEFLERKFAASQFEGIYHRKGRKGDGQDGCSIFFRKEKFSLMRNSAHCVADLVKKYLLQEADFVAGAPQSTLQQAQACKTILQCATLRHMGTGKLVNFANTHLHWPDSAGAVRCVQAAAILRQLEIEAANEAVVIAGDFNSTPETSAVELILTGRTSWSALAREAAAADEHPELAQQSTHKSGNEACMWQRSQAPSFPQAGPRHKMKLTHTFDVDGDLDKAPLTTYTTSFDGTLDWIFFSVEHLSLEHPWKGIETAKLASIATVEGGLPSAAFPSDHLMVMATFSIHES